MIKKRACKSAVIVIISLFMCFAFVVQSSNIDFSTKAYGNEGYGSVTDVTGQVDAVSDQFLQTDDTFGMPQASDEVTAIIRLKDKSLIERLNTTGYSHISDYALSSAGKGYARELLIKQDIVKKNILDEMDASFEDSYTTLLNGFAVKIKYSDYKKLKTINGVEKAMISPQYAAPKLESVVNPVQVYESGIYDSSDVDFDGSGTIVGIFDTGFDYTHPAFSEMPSVLALDKSRVSSLLSQTQAAISSPEIIVDDVYLNDKVPFAYDYADRIAEVYPKNMHGTHVAGIVAGKDDGKILDDGKSFIGVAPGAQLAIFKVFSSNKESADMKDVLTGLSDAVLLKLDVVNLSLGSVSGFTSENDDIQTDEIYENLRQAGISVIVSAGNEGSSASGSAKGSTNLLTNPDSGTIGSPGTYKSPLTVASIDGVKSDYFIANGTTTGYIYNPSDENSNRLIFADKMLNIMSNKQLDKIEYVTVPGVGRAANYMAIDVKDKVALVKRGSISFEDKIKFAQNAGAAAIIIYNNVSGVINMSIGKASELPSCSITMDVGEVLASRSSGNLQFDPTYKAGPFISDFSSWGVNPDLELKPEITAHGGNILSAVPGGYDTTSGTSMSAPNLAGAVTIIRQYIKEKHPEAQSLIEVNEMAYRLLMSTATIARNEQGNPYSPRKQGAGLASLYNTINTRAYLYVEGSDKTKLSVGDDVEKTGIYNMSFSIKNMSNETVSYKMSADVFTETVSSDKITVAEKAYMLKDSRVEFSSPNTYTNGDFITIQGYGSATINVRIELTNAAKSYMDANFANGMYVEGFLKLTPFLDSDIALSVPWVGFYGDWSVAPLFDVSAYDEADSARDISVVDQDKLTADVYASIPMGSFYMSERDGEEFRGYWGLGNYIYTTENESDKPLPYEDRAAISANPNSIDELGYVALGTLRGAKEVEYSITNEATGEVVFSGKENNARKSATSGGQRMSGGVMVELKAYDAALANNNKYVLDVKGKLDWQDGGVDTNLNNTFTSSFYVDSDSPLLDKDKVALRIEERNKIKRYYLDLPVYDSHYLQAMLMLTYSDIVDNEFIDPITFSNYMVPVESRRNTTTKISYEITDYWNLIRKNGDKIYFEVVDYAKNTSSYLITLPKTEAVGISFINSTAERNIDINQVIDLKNDLVMTPSDAWIYNLNWSSSDENVASVNGDGIVTGIAQGSAVISAVSPDGKATGSVTVNVSAKEITPRLEKFILDKTYINAVHGEEGYITAEVVPYNFDVKPIWSSSASDIVQVSVVEGTNGLVAKYKVLRESSGSINIWVRDESSQLIGSNCQINIRPLYKTMGSALMSYLGEGGDGGVVDVPEDLKLTYIMEGAFANNNRIKKVIIPDGVKTLGAYSFEKSTSLTEVVLPESVETIEEGAFDGCTSLTTINLGSVKTISKYAFRGTMLNAVDFANTNFIGMGAFSTNNATAVATFTRADLSNVKYIGAEAFSNCYNLTEVVIAAETIGNGAFAACLKLERVTFLNRVTIGSQAFTLCEKLERVEFQKGAISIGAEAFSHCVALPSFRIPDGLEILGAQAFLNCTKLSNVTISATAKLSVLGANIFRHTAVSRFNLELGNPSFSVDSDGILYDSSKTKIIMYPYALEIADGKYTVASNITQIGNFAFSGIDSLKEVNLNQVKTLARGAFYGCKSLTTVTNVGLLESIGDDAFSECFKLNIGFLNSASLLKSIGSRAFFMDEEKYSQTAQNINITLPSTLESIGEYAFGNLSAIKSVDMSATKIKSLSDFAFFGCAYLDNVSLNSTIASVGSGAFASCSRLKSISLPDSITELGIGIFNYCTALETVKLPKNITYIPSLMFTGTAIVTLELPSSVTYIGDSAFYSCESFVGFSNGMNNVTIIDNFAFAFTAIENFDAPNAVWVGEGFIAWYSADSGGLDDNIYLKKVNLPKAEYIGNYAFVACTELNEVNISKAQYIGVGAFMYCTSLESLDISSAHFIGSVALFDSSIKNLILSDKLTTMQDFALAGANDLDNVSISGSGSYFMQDGVLYSVLPNGGYQLEKYLSDEEEYTILDGTVRIAPEAFAGNKTLNKVTLARSVKTIGDSAFVDTNIKIFEFTSPEMPALEGVLDYYEDPETSYTVIYVAYNNFVANYMEVTGLTMIMPSNGTGYDTYILAQFFEDVQLGGIAMLDATVNAIKMISSLPSSVNLSDREAIEAARAAYNALTPSQRQLITNYSSLTVAEQALSVLIVADIKDRINALPSEVNASHKNLVEQLYSEYNALSASEKTLITNYDKLNAAMETLKTLEKTDDKSYTALIIIFITLAIASIAALVVYMVIKRRAKIENK